MKKKMAAVALLGLSLPVMAQAMEFQTPGALGMGRAGVARTTDAYATFINPAGLAFHEKGFSLKLDGGIGASISSGLGDNVDKIGKLDLGKTKLNFDPATTTEDAIAATSKSVELFAILNNLKEKQGSVSVNQNLALGIQIRSFGTGVIETAEVGAGVKDVDTVNVRIGSTTNGATSTDNITTLAGNMGITAGSPTTSSGAVFNPTQFAQVVDSLKNAGVDPTTAAQMAVQIENGLANGGNKTGLTADQLVAGTTLAVNAFNPNSNSIDNNNTKIALGGLLLVEVPLGYGHKFDLGRFGQLGVGGAAKVMRGSVYYKEVTVRELKDSKDATTQAKDQHKESTQFGLDLGAMWRMEDVKIIGPVNVGLALKNLNSPKFDGPDGTSVKVEPQARLGLGLDPLSWLSIAADMDVTKNKTVVAGRDSQLIGGGLELHFDHWYALWLALRAGAYKNIGETGSKPVLTAGISLGPQYFRLDINGAMATAKGTFDNKSVPLDAKVEFGLSTAFF